MRFTKWTPFSCYVAAATSKNMAFAWMLNPKKAWVSRKGGVPTLSTPLPLFEMKALSSVTDSTFDGESLKWGKKVQIEVSSFGPLGASVDVVGIGHAPEDLIPESDPPLGTGLVLQREISYFREARNNVDVVAGEVLPAYIERVRDDGKLDIALRAPGGKAKAEEVGEMILERLKWAEGGTLYVGDKSTPKQIATEFPGVSKSAFKKAVASLFRKGLVKPGPDSIALMK